MKITVKELSKTFYAPRGGKKETVLENINLQVKRGEFSVLLGPSGCGKTTLLNIMAGFEKPNSGRVLIDGRPVEGPHPDRILMWQFFGLFPWRTVRRNVEFGMEIKGVPPRERKEKALHFIRTVGLGGYQDSHPSGLSGGMKQRVALARMLAADPDILFMDEPFGSLDAPTRHRLEEVLQEILEDTKKTVVFVTHNVREALYLADTIYIMSINPGKIIRRENIPWKRPRSASSEGFRKMEEELFSYIHSGRQYGKMEGI